MFFNVIVCFSCSFELAFASFYCNFGKMKNKILNYVTRYRHVSFAELSNNIDGFDGDFTFSLMENFILWDGMSEEAGLALDDLLKEKKIKIDEATALTYLMDGKSLKLPIAKQCRKYKTPRWLPVVFNPT